LSDKNGQRKPWVRLNPDINIGELVTITMIIGAIVIWGLRLEGRVDLNQNQINTLKELRAEDQSELRARFDRIERLILDLGNKLDRKADKD